jgi:hypothetical protein
VFVFSLHQDDADGFAQRLSLLNLQAGDAFWVVSTDGATWRYDVRAVTAMANQLDVGVRFVSGTAGNFPDAGTELLFAWERAGSALPAGTDANRLLLWNPVTSAWVPGNQINTAFFVMNSASAHFNSLSVFNTSVRLRSESGNQMSTVEVGPTEISLNVEDFSGVSRTNRLSADGASLSGLVRVDSLLVNPGGTLSVLEPSAPEHATPKGYVDEVVTVSELDPVGPPARDGLLWIVVAP